MISLWVVTLTNTDSTRVIGPLAPPTLQIGVTHTVVKVTGHRTGGAIASVTGDVKLAVLERSS